MRIYRIGDVELDPARGTVRRGGVDQHLRQKTFQLLLCLVEQRDRLVTKEELLNGIWKGVAVTDNVLAQSVNDIRRVLGDDPRQPTFVKTVPRAGYRFIGPVEEVNPEPLSEVSVYESRSVQVELEEEVDTGPPQKGRPRFLTAALVLMALVGTLAGYAVIHNNGGTGVDRKTIAVLYFENQSGDAELNWLREGLPDMIITDLSRSQGLVPLGRPRVRDLLGRMGIKDIGVIDLATAMKLAARARAGTIVLGSFGRIHERTRVNVQLYDAVGGNLLAAESLVSERSEQILTDIHLLSLRLAAHLGVGPGKDERGRGLTDAMTSSLEAYRYYSLGVEQVHGMHNREAVGLFQKAVALDPEFAMAWARIGFASMMAGNNVEEGKPYLERAFQLAGRLTEKDRIHIAVWYHFCNLDFERAIGELRRLLARYPAEVEAYEELARLLAGEVRTEEAVRVVQQGLAADPEAKDLYNVLQGLYTELGLAQEAIAASSHYVELAPMEPNAYDSRGLIYLHFGLYDRAFTDLDHSLALQPDFEVARVHLGNLRFRQGKYGDALREYERYVKASSAERDRLRGYGLIARTHLARGDAAHALEIARKLSASIRNLEGPEIVTVVEAGIRKPEDFLTPPPTLASRGSRGSLRREYYWRSRIALRAGRVADAQRFCAEADRQRFVTWDYQRYEDCAAHIFLSSGEWQKARDEYERILKLNPYDALAHYHLAEAHEHSGVAERARSEYQAFLNLWKDADADIPEVVSARRRLQESPAQN